MRVILILMVMPVTYWGDESRDEKSVILLTSRSSVWTSSEQAATAILMLSGSLSMRSEELMFTRVKVVDHQILFTSLNVGEMLGSDDGREVGRVGVTVGAAVVRVKVGNAVGTTVGFAIGLDEGIPVRVQGPREG